MTTHMPNVLIVDDKMLNRLVLKDALSELDVNVHEASSGQEALDSILHHSYCAILMDVNMPVMDGYKTTELMNAHFGDSLVPIIFIAALSDESSIKRCYHMGGADFLAKPVDAEVLVAKISLFRKLYLQRQRIAVLNDEKSAMMEAAGEGIIGIDLDFNISFINSIAAKILGNEKSFFLEKSLKPFICGEATDSDWKNGDIYSAFVAGINTRIERGTMRRCGAEVFPAAYTLSPVSNNGKLVGGVLVFQDSSERELILKELSFLAQNDPLTGLYNRRVFTSTLDKRIKYGSRCDGGIALHFIDLDRFKEINDTLGHDVGDAVIVEVAERLKRCIRDTDTVGRLGGDEFGIIQYLDASEEVGAAWMAKRIVESFDEPLLHNDKEISFGCSLGVALYPDHGKTSKDLLKAADAAMYKSKCAGKNKYHFFNTDMQEQVVKHINTVTALKHAIERDELSVVYQPQVDLKTKRVYGVEALMRWHNSELGQVSPATFIPIAEQCGLIPALGRWILERACKDAKSWIDAGFSFTDDFHLSVNVSVNQMARGNLSRDIQKALDKSNLPPEVLRLEITETVLMKNPEASVQEIEKINALGVEVSIDDFGTGYSSLSYLGVLPASCLKIDRSFVTGIQNNPAHQKIVLSIVRLAESLGHEVVAEGVENEEELKYLASIGCHIVQGFFFCKPVTSEQLIDYISGFSRMFPLKSVADWLGISRRRSYRMS